MDRETEIEMDRERRESGEEHRKTWGKDKPRTSFQF